jgi:predicted ATPase
VQRQLEAVTGEARSIESVEQPELHLHPAAHGDLADLYVEAIKNSNVRFMVETHSENFLLRIRRRVAEGRIDPNDVIIYWINNERGSVSYVQPIHVETDGELDMWPSGVFSEDFEEVRAIRSVRKGSGK